MEEFIEAVWRKVLVENLMPHLGSVIEEFRCVVGGAAIGATWQSVQERIAGTDVDVPTWRGMTTYQGYTGVQDDPVRWWWELLEARDASWQRRLFTWSTGYASMPPGGLRFVIQRGENTQRLPTAATCYFTVRLPPYASREVMEEKLNWALEERGFLLA